MTEFKKGDRVLCVDNMDASKITEGELYTVSVGRVNRIELEGVDGLFYKRRFRHAQEGDMNLDKDKIKDVLASYVANSQLFTKEKPDEGQKISVSGNTVYVVKRDKPDFVDLYFNCFGRWHQKGVELDEITYSTADLVDKNEETTILTEDVKRIDVYETKVELNFTDGSSVVLPKG